MTFRETVGKTLSRLVPGYQTLRDHERGRKATKYTDKAAYKIRYDRDPRLPILADKLAAKEYVAERIGEKHIPRVLASGSEFSETWLEGLPSKFVIKTNHGCGALIVVSPTAPEENRLPESVPNDDWSIFRVRPEHLDIVRVKAITNQWLSQNFGKRGKRIEEWAYSPITPKLFIEEFIEGPDGEVATDYKFWTFNGRVQIISVISSRYGKFSIASYDRNWQRVPLSYNDMAFAPIDEVLPKPEHFDEMIEIAERLTVDIEHARVDLYDTDRGVLFGEFTNYPHGGGLRFKPERYNEIIGADWHPDYRPSALRRRATS